jgi:hypothetical protein
MVGSLAALLIGKHKEMFGKKPTGSELHRMLKLFSVHLGVKGIDNKTGAGFISLNPAAKIVKMNIGSKDYTVNGVPLKMDVAPALVPGGRAVVPVSFSNNGDLIIYNSNAKEIIIVG